MGNVATTVPLKQASQQQFNWLLLVDAALLQSNFPSCGARNLHLVCSNHWTRPFQCIIIALAIIGGTALKVLPVKFERLNHP